MRDRRIGEWAQRPACSPSYRGAARPNAASPLREKSNMRWLNVGSEKTGTLVDSPDVARSRFEHDVCVVYRPSAERILHQE